MSDRQIEREAPTVEEALDAALESLGVDRSAVEYEVLQEGGKRLFGAERPARVRVWLVDDDEPADDDEQDLDLDREERTGGPQQHTPARELSEDEVDRVADEATKLLKEMVAAFGIDCEVDEYEGDYGEVILDVVGDDVAVLIGRHGRTLEALQTLVTSITFKRLGLRHPLLVDVGGYRYRRKAKLDEMARRAAEKVRRTGQPVEMRPMSSYERKVIHMALREDSRVKTESEGEEPFRQVIVLPR